MRIFYIASLFFWACGSSQSPPPSPSQNNPCAEDVVEQDIAFNSDVRLTGYTIQPCDDAKKPGVVLIHQYNESDEQWRTFAAQLAQNDIRVLAFNLRGHGDSAAFEGGPLSDILTDPIKAPADTSAAINYLKSQPNVDSEKIMVIGTSIGANLAVASSLKKEVLGFVSLSSRKARVLDYAGQSRDASPQNGFYISSENDGGGVQAGDAQTFFDDTSGEKKISIVPGSGHGIALVEDHQQDIFQWADLLLK